MALADLIGREFTWILLSLMLAAGMILVAWMSAKRKVSRTNCIIFEVLVILFWSITAAAAFSTDTTSGVMNWAVAVGTVVLAFFAFWSSIQSEKNAQSATDISHKMLESNQKLVEEIKDSRQLEVRRVHRDALMELVSEWQSQLPRIPCVESLRERIDAELKPPVMSRLLFPDLYNNHIPANLLIRETWTELVRLHGEIVRRRESIKKELTSRTESTIGMKYADDWFDYVRDHPGEEAFDLELVEDLWIAKMELLKHPNDKNFYPRISDNRLVVGSRQVSHLNSVDKATQDEWMLKLTAVVEDDFGENDARIQMQLVDEYSKVKSRLEMLLRDIGQVLVLPDGDCAYLAPLCRD